jgi:hypothetical protein
MNIRFIIIMLFLNRTHKLETTLNTFIYSSITGNSITDKMD